MKKLNESFCLSLFPKETGLKRRANLREISYVLKQQSGFDILFINLPPFCINYIDYLPAVYTAA
jgi:hypothetical protein